MASEKAKDEQNAKKSDTNSSQSKDVELKGSDSFVNALRHILEEVRRLRQEIDNHLSSKRNCDYYEREAIRESKEEEAKKIFLELFAAFAISRKEFITELRDIARRSIETKKMFNISTMTGSSVGMVGGLAALAGAIFSPPLFIGGLAVSSIATVSNLSVQFAEFTIFRKWLKEAEELASKDMEFAKSVEEVYEEIKLSNLFSNINAKSKETVESNRNDVKSLGLQLYSGSTKGAVALGIRTIGLESVSYGSALLKGVARGALGLVVIVDGVTMVLTANDYAKGSCTDFAKALMDMADRKEKELYEACKNDSYGLLDQLEILNEIKQPLMQDIC